MYKQSSNRIPNSPGIDIVGSLLKHMPTAIGVLFPFTKLVHSWPSKPIPWPVLCGRPGNL